MTIFQHFRRHVDRALAGHDHQDLDVYLHEERDVAQKMHAIAKEQREAADYLTKWGYNEGDFDLRDISDRCCSLLHHISVAFKRHADVLDVYRDKLKVIQLRERAVQPLRDRYRDAEAALAKLKKQPASNILDVKLVTAERELVGAEAALVEAEGQLAELKRSQLRDALHLRFASLVEFGLIAQTAGIHGRYVADNMPVGHFNSDPRPPYTQADVTLRIVSDAKTAIDRIQEQSDVLELVAQGLCSDEEKSHHLSKHGRTAASKPKFTIAEFSPSTSSMAIRTSSEACHRNSLASSSMFSAESEGHPRYRPGTPQPKLYRDSTNEQFKARHSSSTYDDCKLHVDFGRSRTRYSQSDLSTYQYLPPSTNACQVQSSIHPATTTTLLPPLDVGASLSLGEMYQSSQNTKQGSMNFGHSAMKMPMPELAPPAQTTCTNLPLVENNQSGGIFNFFFGSGKRISQAQTPYSSAEMLPGAPSR